MEIPISIIIRLKYEKKNLELAKQDFEKSYSNCSEKKIRREIGNMLSIVEARINEFDRVLNLLNINLKNESI